MVSSSSRAMGTSANCPTGRRPPAGADRVGCLAAGTVLFHGGIVLLCVDRIGAGHGLGRWPAAPVLVHHAAGQRAQKQSGERPCTNQCRGVIHPPGPEGA